MSPGTTAVDAFLRPADVLRFLADAPGIVADAPEPSEGIRRLVGRAVPLLADEVVLYVLGSDGRLHPRLGIVGTGEGCEIVEDPGEPLSPGADHPAALACRSARLALLEEGEAYARLHGDESRSGDVTDPRRAIRAVGLPLVRDGDAAAALYLAVDGERRHYRAEDLDYLAHVGAMLSLTLESARLRREAREARRAKTDFLSVMSHELRTPLTAIVGYADLMEAGIPGPVNESQQGQLGRIKESAWELLELIDGILGFARYEGESPELGVEEVHPAELLEDTLAVFRASLLEKGIELHQEWPDDLPRFRTDRDKAVRILFHLLSNAQKFTREGEVRVAIEAGERWITFVVSDTGPGIGVTDLKMIFEPFWQAQRPETRTAGGTGMGLSLARRLTELLSGELDVRSRLGEGTTVSLRLPREGPLLVFP